MQVLCSQMPNAAVIDGSKRCSGPALRADSNVRNAWQPAESDSTLTLCCLFKACYSDCQHDWLLCGTAQMSVLIHPLRCSRPVMSAGSDGTRARVSPLTLCCLLGQLLRLWPADL